MKNKNVTVSLGMHYLHEEMECCQTICIKDYCQSSSYQYNHVYWSYPCALSL